MSLVENELQSNATPVIRILSWNKHSYATPNKPWWDEGMISARYGCELENGADCVYVKANRTSYNDSQIVLFNFHRLDLKDMPKYRPPGQKWIFSMYESPSLTNKKLLSRLKFAFNATMTKMTQADIPVPFETYAAGDLLSLKQSDLEKLKASLTTMVNKKSKMVAWFVSNCRTPSAREKYVKKLSKYVQVDVFGQCGTLNCSQQSSDGMDCDRMLDSEYRFYLSFENSLCEDYVTEKLRRAIRRDVIPIVLGGANYTKFLPPDTYLDVRNFKSAQHLATYLYHLTNRTSSYVDCLLRKRLMVLRKSENPVCTLCRYAHANLNVRRQVDLAVVWNSKKFCKTPKDFYAGVLWAACLVVHDELNVNIYNSWWPGFGSLQWWPHTLHWKKQSMLFATRWSPIGHCIDKLFTFLFIPWLKKDAVN